MSLLLPTENTVVLSTSHIPLHTAVALGQPAEGTDHQAACRAAELWDVLSYTGYEFGWIICSASFDGGVMEEFRRDHAALACLLEMSLAQGATLLRLDCDAETVEGLATFDW